MKSVENEVKKTDKTIIQTVTATCLPLAFTLVSSHLCHWSIALSMSDCCIPHQYHSSFPSNYSCCVNLSPDC